MIYTFDDKNCPFSERKTFPGREKGVNGSFGSYLLDSANGHASPNELEAVIRRELFCSGHGEKGEDPNVARLLLTACILTLPSNSWTRQE